jgi:hypothetical protein
MITRVPDAADPDRRQGGKPDGNRGVANPGTFAQECPVAFYLGKHTPRPGMVVATERRTCTAHAVMEDLNMLAICRGKNSPACALWDRRNGSVPGGRSPGFLFFYENTAFPHKPGYPVLRRTPWDAGCFLDISYRKKTGILRELAHQEQVFPTVFKHAGHSGRGCTGYRR